MSLLPFLHPIAKGNATQLPVVVNEVYGEVNFSKGRKEENTRKLVYKCNNFKWHQDFTELRLDNGVMFTQVPRAHVKAM